MPIAQHELVILCDVFLCWGVRVRRVQLRAGRLITSTRGASYLLLFRAVPSNSELEHAPVIVRRYKLVPREASSLDTAKQRKRPLPRLTLLARG